MTRNGHEWLAERFEENRGHLRAVAYRQLASRARRRVQGVSSVSDADLAGQRKIVDAFLAAMRGRDFEALVAVLDPDVVVRADVAARAPGSPGEVRGAREWAGQAIVAARGAVFARPALINGEVGIVVAPHGRLFRVLRFTFEGGKIARIDVVGDPASLDELDLAVLED